MCHLGVSSSIQASMWMTMFTSQPVVYVNVWFNCKCISDLMQCQFSTWWRLQKCKWLTCIHAIGLITDNADVSASYLCGDSQNFHENPNVGKSLPTKQRQSRSSLSLPSISIKPCYEPKQNSHKLYLCQPWSVTVTSCQQQLSGER